MNQTFSKQLRQLIFAIILMYPLSIFAQMSPEENQIEEQSTIPADDEYEEVSAWQTLQEEPRIIKEIKIEGNKYVTNQAILHRIPFRIGETFDPRKTRLMIKQLYYDLKRFRHIKLLGELIGDDQIILTIKVQEKYPLKDITFKGNSAISEKDLNEKINLKEIPAINGEELGPLTHKIHQLYTEKGYYSAQIKPELIVDEQDQASLLFNIVEGKKAVVKRINFTGNNHVSDKQLRNVMITKEDWILSFLDHAGLYHPDRLEGDKHMIEQLYQNSGFLHAKVYNVITNINPETNHIRLIFEINEGPIYRISEVKAPGNDLLQEPFLLANIPLKTGQLYNRERIVNSIKALENLWGNLGYIFASIDPTIIPDDENKTVAISFQSDLGSQVKLNKLTIKGNRKTRDKVIRRQITLDEGELLTRNRMEESKGRVESLGFFDQREGVNWKIKRLNKDEVDLDLIVKEVKTGHAGFQLGFNGTPRSILSPLQGANIDLGVSDTNIGGTGIKGNLMTRLSHEDISFMFNLTQPWMFDKPIFGSIDVVHRRLAYEEFQLTNPVNERDTGATLTGGFLTSFGTQSLRDTFIRTTGQLHSVNYENQPTAFKSLPEEAQRQLNFVLAQEFDPGNYAQFALQMGQERRNHPIHPTNGYSWLARSMYAVKAQRGCLGFMKFDLDAHWFTPLIGAYDLIFHLHGYLGIVAPFHNRLIPYRDLFHIGGPASVRGFLYGQIGPQFCVPNNEGVLRKDSIGGKKATFINAELIFPITADFNMKGILFYDGGTGWDNPFADDISLQYLCSNNFSYRHAVGFGLRVLSPTPIRVDWGFKLDPRKGEPGYEVHFGMTYDW